MADTLIQHFASSGSEALSLLMQPEADITHIGVTPFALAIRLGMRLHVVGVAQRLGASHGVVLREGLQVNRWKKPSKNRPLVLGTMAGSTGHEIASTWALQQRVAVRFLYLSPAQQLLAFRDRYVDGIASWEPFLTQARNIGGVPVCNADCLPAGSFNVLCATEAALRNKPGAIQRFLRAVSRISTGLASGDLLEELGSLPWLYGRTTSVEQFKDMVQKGYSWPTEPLSHTDRAALTRTLEASDAFLERANFPDDRRILNETFAVPEARPGEPDTTLHVGYTDSFMCTAYHLAVIRGEFQRHGFRVPGPSLTRGQRLALLKSAARRDQIFKLESRVTDDPESVISDCRRLSEAMLSDVYCQLRGEDPARAKNSAEKVSGKLNSYGCFPDQSVYTITHALRINGNQALHYASLGIIARQDLIANARECIDQLLRIDEWYECDAVKALGTSRCCWNCEKMVEREQNFCTVCGNEQLCRACHKVELKPAWKNCANCGVPLHRTSSPQAAGPLQEH